MTPQNHPLDFLKTQIIFAFDQIEPSSFGRHSSISGVFGSIGSDFGGICCPLHRKIVETPRTIVKIKTPKV